MIKDTIENIAISLGLGKAEPVRRRRRKKTVRKAVRTRKSNKKRKARRY